MSVTVDECYEDEIKRIGTKIKTAIEISKTHPQVYDEPIETVIPLIRTCFYELCIESWFGENINVEFVFASFCEMPYRVLDFLLILFDDALLIILCDLRDHILNPKRYEVMKKYEKDFFSKRNFILEFLTKNDISDIDYDIRQRAIDSIEEKIVDAWESLAEPPLDKDDHMWLRESIESFGKEFKQSLLYPPVNIKPAKN